ncbi:MAG TPA: bifunctional diguanylate cyclase/phosphodiesterase [Ktedonobacteraceae bacterium]
MKLKRTNQVSRLNNLMRLVAMLSIFVFLIWAAILIRQASNSVQTATFVRSTYQQMDSTLASEQASLYEYVLNPIPTVRAEYQAAATTLSSLAQALQHDADSSDDPFGQQVFAQQASQAVYSTQFFSAIDAHDLTRANALRSRDIDPSFEHIAAVLDQQTQIEAAEATASLAQLTQVQRTILVVGPLLLLAGLLLLAVSIWVSRSYQGKLDEATRAELARFERMALTDPLTELGNYYAYQEQLAGALAQVGQEDAAIALALLDIDEFKVVNDDQGHQRGDDILREIGAVLRESHLSSALFRLGADDFAVIVPAKTLAGATIALERICEDVRQRLFTITVSIGVTHADAPGLSLAEMQTQVSLALQEAKRRGRNRVVTFAAIAGDASFVPLEKRQAVRRLLSERQMTVAFQPIWDLASGTVLAFEALSRPDASYGLSGPQELFDIAEQMGRAHELDAVCVEKILARAAELPSDVLLFLNLTPQSLVHDLLTGATLLEAVVSAGLTPSRVVVEITERSIVKLADVVQKVKFLRLMGFRVALDDAGAGNAGLEMLSQLPVDFIKIDRDVVGHALTDQIVYGVLAGIITIARASHASVIAEGIENPEMLDMVQRLEVQCAQGYLLGRPSQTISGTTTLKDAISFIQRSSHDASAAMNETLMNPLHDVYA